MPFIREFKNALRAVQLWAGGILDWIVGVLSPLRAFGFGAGVIVTVFSGAWLAALPGTIIADTFLHARSLHLVTGFAVTLGLAYEICRWIARAVSRLIVRFKRRAGDAAAAGIVGAAHELVLPPRPRILGAVYWILLAVVLLSGFEVWMFHTYHFSLIPVVTPLRWRIVHTVATTYFGAVLLLIYARHAMNLYLRLRAYLLSP